ncbi:hypothetical protein [Segniliparus rugosus]|uniref:Uncharacterized protein n=1 Tax=Segniliparus rugosus (strain ATCC BAA-974 / DSM 45345 / CCUG 50838 / CIP 108380 / JCM 13579 / CDC 945) TaxID=679197 RepID=E5XQK7_SEGRC|nr:hypothetical protein [Segniliparus rugosus]EFV13381.1 hypothetical protein HMPREF9336_01770 [Segniliparus rugosus ATCC BAA-974]
MAEGDGELEPPSCSLRGREGRGSDSPRLADGPALSEDLDGSDALSDSEGVSDVDGFGGVVEGFGAAGGAVQRCRAVGTGAGTVQLPSVPNTAFVGGAHGWGDGSGCGAPGSGFLIAERMKNRAIKTAVEVRMRPPRIFSGTNGFPWLRPMSSLKLGSFHHEASLRSF